RSCAAPLLAVYKWEHRTALGRLQVTGSQDAGRADWRRPLGDLGQIQNAVGSGWRQRNGGDLGRQSDQASTQFVRRGDRTFGQRRASGQLGLSLNEVEETHGVYQ